MSSDSTSADRSYRYTFDPDIIGDLNHALSFTPPYLLPSAASADARHRSRLALAADHRTRFLDRPFETPLPSSSGIAGTGLTSMARPGSSQRPTHIALPPNSFPRGETSPSGSPGPLASPTSPRSSFLPSFIRNRSRAATITGRGSPRVEQPDPMARAPVPPVATNGASIANGRDSGGVTRSVSTPSGGGLAAAANGGQASAGPAATGPSIDPKGKTHRIRLVPHLETSRSLAFDPVIRELYPISVHSGITPSAAASAISNLGPLNAGKPPALVLKIGRFTDKTPAIPEADRPATGIGGATIAISGGGGEVTSGKVAFKSKVVSRTHAEIWCEAGGKFYIRDTSSSSGTFLNHIRLSSPNTDSRPTQLNDGDVLQLGVDYQGGHEDQFRCVKMRVELGREWQRAANEFNTNALKQLKALGGVPITPDSKGKGESSAASVSKKSKGSVTDCCICLFSVTVCQSLFIAPCSHVFHYKCIRPLLQQHHPGFSCPLCRTFANLEEDVEIDDPPEAASRRTSSVSRRRSNHSLRLTGGIDPISPTSGAGQPNVSNAGEEFDLEAAIGDENDPPAGEGGSTSEDGGRTEDDTRNNGAEQSEDVEMGSDSREASIAIAEPESSSAAGPSSGLASATALARGAEARRQAILASSRRSSGSPDPLYTAAIPDVQTPMNEYFLSTLAPGGIPVVNPEGMLGVQQQLDGAVGGRSSRRESGGMGGHAQETTMVGSTVRQRDVEDEEDEAGDRRRRAESEMMMYT